MKTESAAYAVSAETMELRKLAEQAGEAARESDKYWCLAAELADQVKAKGAYKAAGFENFAAYCESPKGLRLKESSVNNQIRAWRILSAKMTPDEIVTVSLRRALAIAPHLENGNNALELIKLARTADAKTFEAEMARIKGKSGDAGLVPFRVMVDADAMESVIRPALDRVKRIDGDITDGTALERICADFNAGPGVIEPVTGGA